MQKLALQREAELKELERQRREEFARKRQKELIGQRDWERRTLQTLRQQTSELDQQLSQLVSGCGYWVWFRGYPHYCNMYMYY